MRFGQLTAIISGKVKQVLVNQFKGMRACVRMFYIPSKSINVDLTCANNTKKKPILLSVEDND